MRGAPAARGSSTPTRCRRTGSRPRRAPEEAEPQRPDGTTVYSRPLPGKARMYPETDVPPIRVPEEQLARLREGLPERPEIRTARLVPEYGIPEQQARQP